MSSATRIRWARISDSWICGAVRMPFARSSPTTAGELTEQRPGEFEMLVGGQPKAQPELGIVLEQRIRPCRPAALAVLRPWRHRLVGAVDRRAAGGIGDLSAVPEQLREELEIRRLAASGAGAGELEQGLEELHAANVGEIDASAVIDRKLLEEGDVDAFARDQRLLVGEVDGLDPRLARADRRAGFDTETTAGAVLDIELQAEAGFRVAARVDRGGLERAGRRGERVLVIVTRANDAVRADEAALSALDTEILFPNRHDFGDVPLLVGAGARRKGAVRRHEADGNVVTAPDHHPGRHAPHEVGGSVGHDRRQVPVTAHRRRRLDLVEARQRTVDRSEVLGDHRLALAAVSLADRFLNVPDRRLARQHAGDREEAGLEDGVGAPGKTHLTGNLGGIDDEEAEALVDDLPLHRPRQLIEDLVRSVGCIEQEDAARRRQP